MSSSAPPDALMLLGSHCPHCPSVLAGLSELVKSGMVGRLEVVNLEVRPDMAQRLGVRSVPWLRLGPFELEGPRSPAELRDWAERAGTEAGVAEYFRELLDQGQLSRVVRSVEKESSYLGALLILLDDAQTAFQVRLGIGAVMEEMSGSEALKQQVDRLAMLARHEDPVVRSDAGHFLALSQDRRALDTVSALTRDRDPQVREVAEEALDSLRNDIGA